MKIIKTLVELAQQTAATAGDANMTTVAPSSGDEATYVTIIVVVVVVMFLILGLAVYKSYRTWASTTTRRRHNSQKVWLAEDNPEIWADEAAFDRGEQSCLYYHGSDKRPPLLLF